MPYIPAPRLLKAFPEAQLVKSKTRIQGGKGLRKRWKDLEGNIYEWDSRHGRVEKYNKRGKHLGEFDPETGEQINPPNPDYEVEP